MAWVKWNSITDFNTWHDNIKAELGLPKLSVDAQGNAIPNSVVNEAYVIPVIVADNDVRANVAQEYALGLNLSQSPFVSNYEA